MLWSNEALSTCHPVPEQVLADAKAVDDAAKAGKDVRPLCGLAFAIKDNLDVLGCAPARGHKEACIILLLSSDAMQHAAGTPQQRARQSWRA